MAALLRHVLAAPLTRASMDAAAVSSARSAAPAVATGKQARGRSLSKTGRQARARSGSKASRGSASSARTHGSAGAGQRRTSSVLELTRLAELSESSIWRGERDFGVTALFDLATWEARWEGHAASSANSVTSALATPGKTRRSRGATCAARGEPSPALLAAQTLAANIKQAAVALMWGPRLLGAWEAIDAAVAAKQLQVRADRAIYNSKSASEEITHLLFHVHPAWLRVALEAVTSTDVEFPAHAAQDGGYAALRRFIHKHVLQSEDLHRQYKDSVGGLLDAKHIAAQNAAAWATLLKLIVFLDAAACSSLLAPAGLHAVFLPESKIKSFAEFANVFMKKWAAGERNLAERLASLEAPLTWSQPAVMELDFAMPAGMPIVDALRDGTRLARLVEVLAEAEPFSVVSKVVRLPTSTLTTRKRNVVALFKLLRDQHGLDVTSPEHGIGCTADDVVQGKQPHVAALVWTLVGHFTLPVLAAPWRMRKATMQHLTVHPQAAHTAVARVLGCSPSPAVVTLELAGVTSPATVLLALCAAVACQVGCAVVDWSHSWASGHAAAAILQAYAPGLLPASSLAPGTSEWPEAQQFGAKPSSVDAATWSAALAQDRANWFQVSQAVASLSRTGVASVPPMMPACDAGSPPPAALTQAWVAYLFSALMVRAGDWTAAVTLQRAWRSVQLVRKTQLAQALARPRTTAAAFKVTAAMRCAGRAAAARRRVAAATRVAAWWKGVCARDFLQTERVVCHILRVAARRWAEARVARIAHDRAAVATSLQSWWRCVAAVRQYRAAQCQRAVAASRIATAWRAACARADGRSLRARVVRAVVQLQATWRMHLVLASIEREFHEAALSVVVANLRCWTAQRRYARARAGIIQLQRVVRAKQGAARRARQQAAATRIQCFVRGALARQQANWRYAAVVICQAWARGGMARREAARRQAAAARITRVGAVWAARAQQSRRRRQRGAEGGVVLAQALARGWLVRHAATPHMRKVAARVAAANAAATPRATLRARSQAALRVLLHSQEFARLQEAAIDLETVVALSPACAHAMVAGGAVPMLFAVIRSCNRSLQHAVVVCAAMATLRHLVARGGALAAAVATAAEAVDTLLDVAQMFRDKLAIARPAVLMLRVLAQHQAPVTRQLCAPAAMKRLRGLHTMFARQVRMQQRLAEKTGEAVQASAVPTSAAQAAVAALGGAAPLREDSADAVNDVASLLRFLTRACGVPGAGETSASVPAASTQRAPAAAAAAATSAPVPRLPRRKSSVSKRV